MRAPPERGQVGRNRAGGRWSRSGRGVRAGLGAERLLYSARVHAPGCRRARRRPASFAALGDPTRLKRVAVLVPAARSRSRSSPQALKSGRQGVTKHLRCSPTPASCAIRS